MFIVVESGSTKADWMIIDYLEKTKTKTKGMNPYFHDENMVFNELKKNDVLFEIKHKVEKIFFYGAGCSSPKLNFRIEKGLKAFFMNCSTSINHDLEACAYACYNNEPEIACIIGTGSNSCYYDGNKVVEEIPSVGHHLGDEASGNYFGKILLADFLYKRLPEAMHNELVDMGLNKDVIIENVYQKPDVNVYIASFMPVLIKHKETEYAKNIIKAGFQRFLDIHVKCYSNYKDCEVNFVGSVADFLRDELHEVCKVNDIRIGRIIRRPLENLVQYHQSIM